MARNWDQAESWRKALREGDIEAASAAIPKPTFNDCITALRTEHLLPDFIVAEVMGATLRKAPPCKIVPVLLTLLRDCAKRAEKSGSRQAAMEIMFGGNALSGELDPKDESLLFTWLVSAHLPDEAVRFFEMRLSAPSTSLLGFLPSCAEIKPQGEIGLLLESETSSGRLSPSAFAAMAASGFPIQAVELIKFGAKVPDAEEIERWKLVAGSYMRARADKALLMETILANIRQAVDIADLRAEVDALPACRRRMHAI